MRLRPARAQHTHPASRPRCPPRKLSCTCRSPRPGRSESRRTPTLSAMELRADGRPGRTARCDSVSPDSPGRFGSPLPPGAPRRRLRAGSRRAAGLQAARPSVRLSTAPGHGELVARGSAGNGERGAAAGGCGAVTQAGNGETFHKTRCWSANLVLVEAGRVPSAPQGASAASPPEQLQFPFV